MMRKLIVIILGLLGICSIGLGIYYKAPFFARPAALGEAVVSLPGDANSIFYNPAGINSNTISFSLTEWFLDTRAGTFAGSYKFRNYFTIGTGISYFSYGQMQYFDEYGNPGDYFSAGLWQYRIGVAKQIYNCISLGIGTKVLHQTIEVVKETKVLPDFGILATTKFLDIGASMHDVSMCGDGTVAEIGLSVKPTKELLLLGAMNYDVKAMWRAGIEYNFKPVYFRVGYADKNISVGIGYQQKGFTLDYAMVNHRDLGLTHQFSITVK